MTGYLTTSGQDLSSVFMSITNNRFNNGLIINNNLTLPTTYSSVPTQFQLGGKMPASFGETNLTSDQITTPVSITLPTGGVYFIEFLISYIQTNNAMTRFRLGISTVSNEFNIVESSEYMVGVTSANYSYRFIASGIYATTVANQTIYGVHSYTFSGAAKASGSISYTRIA
jgi:hypothetical protein